jgi:SAM-dependent methyltransferase
MHVAAGQFIAYASTFIDWAGARVAEVGSLDVNGQARDHVPAGWDAWFGIDLRGGPGVSIVGDASQILGPGDDWDVIVCAEVLEHCQRWQTLTGVMVAGLRPGGHLLLTCAGTGREPHGADGGSLTPGEWYANVPADELVEHLDGVAVILSEDQDGDTRLLARKP